MVYKKSIKKGINKKVKKEDKNSKTRIAKQVSVLSLSIILMVLTLFSLDNNRLGITIFTIYESTTSSINDTYIRENFESPQGSATSIKIGRTAGNAEMSSLLYFNISSIPTGYTINSAILQLFTSFSSNSNNVTVRAYALNSPWSEEATWLNNTENSAWTSSGGDYSATLLNEINITQTLNVQYNLTISTIVRNWVNGTMNNYGIILISSNASSGDWKEMYSSEYITNTSLIPKITIDYTENAPPTINNLTTSSNLANPVVIGNNITFTLNWSDLDDASVQIFVCNSSSINKSSGCASATYCNTSLASTNPATCSYIAQNSDNRTTIFWAAVCDLGNCSSASNSTFYANHLSNVTITQPNGGETLNQSQGNYLIKYNISDADADKLTGDLYYGTSSGSTSGVVASNLNLTTNCTDVDSTTATNNPCTYSWNTTGLYGGYFLTIIVNDSYSLINTTSVSQFSIFSLVDNTTPNITSPWINESVITSGATIHVYANASDPNLRAVWFSLNTTLMQNITMSNITVSAFNGTFIAPAVGTYQIIAYANDTTGNINQSSALLFNVTKPGAVVQAVNAPATSLTYATVRISADLNATNNLRDTSVYLYVPSGFLFLSGYPQQTAVKNYTVGETNTSNWFLSTPLEQSNYTLNVTYTDYYSNTWNSSNAYISTNTSSQSSSAYTIDIFGYPEVETTQSYLVQADFKSGGINTAADSAKVSLYDSLGNLVVGPASMNNPSTGNYNYSYTIGGSVNEGQWQTIVNITKNSVSYYANQYWKVVGGPFDVRNITVDNSAINALQISVTTENTGGATKDLTLTWNLTRVDNNTVLDTGSDTFAVSAASTRAWTINPTTTYVGQVRISFLGTYSGTEKAGAFKIFSTTPALSGSGSSSSSGSGSGGGGASSTTAQTKEENVSVKEYDALISVAKEIYITKSIKKIIRVGVENTGKKELHKVRLIIENITPESYTISPESISKIKPDEKTEFIVTISADKLAEKNDVVYKIKSDEIERVIYGKIIVVSLREALIKEIGRLQAELSQLKPEIKSGKLSEKYFECEKMVKEAGTNTENEEYISAKNSIENADKCITDRKKRLSSTVKIPPYIWWITGIVLGMMILGVIIYLLYKIYRRTNVMSLLENNPKNPAERKKERKKSAKSEYFNKKLAEIEKKLEDRTDF